MSKDNTNELHVGRLKQLKADYYEMYSYRNVLKSLVLKNLFGRYKNSTLGFGWHFVMPLFMMFVYYVVFSAIKVNPIPFFWVYLASGIFPFNYIMSNYNSSAGIITGNVGMVKKMYFPREIIVLSQVISSFVVLIIGYSIMIVVTIITGYGIKIENLLMLPFVLLLMTLFVAGFSLIFSTINVYFRDFQYIISTSSMALFFMTPMFYTVYSISGLLKQLIWFNPFTYYIEAFHHLIYYSDGIPGEILLMCIIIALFTLVIGFWLFRKYKGGFAERL